MKKISLKSIKVDEFLSREDLKQIMGGDSGSGAGGTLCPNKACSSTIGLGEGQACANDNRKGTCGYVYGIWGCDARTPC